MKLYISQIAIGFCAAVGAVVVWSSVTQSPAGHDASQGRNGTSDLAAGPEAKLPSGWYDLSLATKDCQPLLATAEMLADPSEQPDVTVWANVAKPGTRIIGKITVTHNKDGGLTETIPTGDNVGPLDDLNYEISRNADGLVVEINWIFPNVAPGYGGGPMFRGKQRCEAYQQEAVNR